MAIYGYARVYGYGQTLDSQYAALKAACCQIVYRKRYNLDNRTDKNWRNY